MLIKKIKYKDYDGNEREEEHRFNLNQAEVLEIELSMPGGLMKNMQTIVEAQDGNAIMKIFKMLILKSYGVKSPDGRVFKKSEEISKEFEQTEAYNTLFIELVTNPDLAAKFVNGIIPPAIAEPPITPAQFQNN